MQGRSTDQAQFSDVDSNDYTPDTTSSPSSSDDDGLRLSLDDEIEQSKRLARGIDEAYQEYLAKEQRADPNQAYKNDQIEWPTVDNSEIPLPTIFANLNAAERIPLMRSRFLTQRMSSEQKRDYLVTKIDDILRAALTAIDTTINLEVLNTNIAAIPVPSVEVAQWSAAPISAAPLLTLRDDLKRAITLKKQISLNEIEGLIADVIPDRFVTTIQADNSGDDQEVLNYIKRNVARELYRVALKDAMQTWANTQSAMEAEKMGIRIQIAKELKEKYHPFFQIDYGKPTSLQEAYRKLEALPLSELGELAEKFLSNDQKFELYKIRLNLRPNDPAIPFQTEYVWLQLHRKIWFAPEVYALEKKVIASSASRPKLTETSLLDQVATKLTSECEVTKQAVQTALTQLEQQITERILAVTAFEERYQAHCQIAKDAALVKQATEKIATFRLFAKRLQTLKSTGLHFSDNEYAHIQTMILMVVAQSQIQLRELVNNHPVFWRMVENYCKAYSEHEPDPAYLCQSVAARLAKAAETLLSDVSFDFDNYFNTLQEFEEYYAAVPITMHQLEAASIVTPSISRYATLITTATIQTCEKMAKDLTYQQLIKYEQVLRLTKGREPAEQREILQGLIVADASLQGIADQLLPHMTVAEQVVKLLHKLPQPHITKPNAVTELLKERDQLLIKFNKRAKKKCLDETAPSFTPETVQRVDDFYVAKLTDLQNLVITVSQLEDKLDRLNFAICVPGIQELMAATLNQLQARIRKIEAQQLQAKKRFLCHTLVFIILNPAWSDEIGTLGDAVTLVKEGRSYQVPREIAHLITIIQHPFYEGWWRDDNKLNALLNNLVDPLSRYDNTNTFFSIGKNSSEAITALYQYMDRFVRAAPAKKMLTPEEADAPAQMTTTLDQDTDFSKVDLTEIQWLLSLSSKKNQIASSNKAVYWIIADDLKIKNTEVEVQNQKNAKLLHLLRAGTGANIATGAGGEEPPSPGGNPGASDNGGQPAARVPTAPAAPVLPPLSNWERLKRLINEKWQAKTKSFHKNRRRILRGTLLGTVGGLALFFITPVAGTAAATGGIFTIAGKLLALGTGMGLGGATVGASAGWIAKGLVRAIIRHHKPIIKGVIVATTLTTIGVVLWPATAAAVIATIGSLAISAAAAVGIGLTGFGGLVAGAFGLGAASCLLGGAVGLIKGLFKGRREVRPVPIIPPISDPLPPPFSFNSSASSLDPNSVLASPVKIISTLTPLPDGSPLEVHSQKRRERNRLRLRRRRNAESCAALDINTDPTEKIPLPSEEMIAQGFPPEQDIGIDTAAALDINTDPTEKIPLPSEETIAQGFPPEQDIGIDTAGIQRGLMARLQAAEERSQLLRASGSFSPPPARSPSPTRMFDTGGVSVASVSLLTQVAEPVSDATFQNDCTISPPPSPR